MKRPPRKTAFREGWSDVDSRTIPSPTDFEASHGISNVTRLPTTMDRTAFLDRVDELKPPGKCSDWGAKLQHLCEHFWSSLDDDAAAVDPVCVQSFVDLLSEERAFSIAKLVIPQLRAKSSTVEETNAWKIQIIEGTTAVHDSSIKSKRTKQADFDHPLYSHEKEVFTDSEMYRARLFLHRDGRADAGSDNAIREWLEARPSVLRKPAKDDGDEQMAG
ncbi:hypothetical protein MBLNU459_g7158t1 [Dothideomycetes sp. NU459]